jgi:hypothetical protein
VLGYGDGNDTDRGVRDLVAELVARTEQTSALVYSLFEELEI